MRWIVVVRRIDSPSDDAPTTFVRSEDLQTALVPAVTPDPPARHRGWVTRLAPWAVFGLVAVVVIVATTVWSTSLQRPEAALMAGASPTLVEMPDVAAAPTEEPPPPVLDEPVATSKADAPRATTAHPRAATTTTPPAPAAPPPPPPAAVQAPVATTTVAPTKAAKTPENPNCRVVGGRCATTADPTRGATATATKSAAKSATRPPGPTTPRAGG